MNLESNKEDPQILQSRKELFKEEFNHIENYPYYSSKENTWLCDFCGRELGWSKAYDGFEEMDNHISENHFESNPEAVLWMEEHFLRLILLEKKIDEFSHGRFSN